MGTHISIQHTVANKLDILVFENGDRSFKYTIRPIRMTNAVVFSIDEIVPYAGDTDGMTFLTAIGIMFYLSNTNIVLFDMLVTYQSNDNIMFGIDKVIAPVAFNSNDSFIDSLHMENLLDDDDTFHIITVHDTCVTFEITGMEYAYSMSILEDGLQVQLKN